MDETQCVQKHPGLALLYCWRRVQADTDPMSVNCWASLAGAGQYPFSPSQYSMLAGVCALSIHAPMPFKCWPASYTMAGIGLMHVTPTRCQVNGGLA